MKPPNPELRRQVILIYKGSLQCFFFKIHSLKPSQSFSTWGGNTPSAMPTSAPVFMELS